MSRVGAKRPDPTKDVHMHVNATIYDKAMVIAKKNGQSFRQIVERALTDLIFQEHVANMQRRG